MGNHFSLFASTAGNKDETLEEKQKRLQREHGVLIPPSFVLGGLLDADNMPISCQAELKNIDNPSLLDYLWKTNPGRQLLQEYMRPGIWLSVPTSSEGQILVALNAHTSAGSATSASASNIHSNAASTSASHLWAGQSLAFPPMKLEMLVPTNGQPSIQVSCCPMSSKFALSARLSNSSIRSKYNGWVEGKYKTKTASGINLVLGSWMSMDSIQSLVAPPSSSSPTTLHLQAGAEYQQSLIAAQAKVPLTTTSSSNTSSLPDVETMISLNLNDKNQAPLWLTLKQQQQQSWVLNLSQLLTFDRPVWNVLEERAPLVRQSLGWAVQVETANDRGQDNDESSSYNANSMSQKWSVGATWQWNRALACKAVLVNGHTMQYGAILKRWHQPRVTLSVLNSFHLPTAKHSFLGFGIELETTSSMIPSLNNNTTNSREDAGIYQETANVQDTPPPPTKIQIPKKY
jgi:hypothetical protein